MKADDYINSDRPDAGLTVRDHIAIEAMVGYLANMLTMGNAISGWEENGGDRPTCIAEFISGLSYEMADAMLKQSEE